MDFPTVLVFVTGLLAGLVAGLKIIAPRTATKADDKVLAMVERLEDVLLGLASPAKTEAATTTVVVLPATPAAKP